MKLSGNPIKWNPFNKVVQDHRDGTVYREVTDVEREKRGLSVPWKPEPPAKWCCKGVKTDDPIVDQHEPHCQYHHSNWEKSAQPPQKPSENIQ